MKQSLSDQAENVWCKSREFCTGHVRTRRWLPQHLWSCQRFLLLSFALKSRSCYKALWGLSLRQSIMGTGSCGSCLGQPSWQSMPFGKQTQNCNACYSRRAIIVWQGEQKQSLRNVQVTSSMFPEKLVGSYTKALLDRNAQMTLLYQDFYDKYRIWNTYPYGSWKT